MIELNTILKSYDKNAQQPVLNNVSLHLPAGQFATIMGPSGSGKSTMLNLIAGLDCPTKGGIFVNSVAVHTLNEAKLARYRCKQIGFIYQFFNLLNQLTVLDNIILPAQLIGTKTSVAKQRAYTLLEQLEITEKVREYPSKLSGGQRQRVAIARALMNEPSVLLADEPTGALDSHSGKQVMDLIADLHRQGQTILMVTHDVHLATTYAQRIINLRDGQITKDTMISSTSTQNDNQNLQMVEAH
jgi:putative ABC transport system ATP-binding protein